MVRYFLIGGLVVDVVLGAAELANGATPNMINMGVCLGLAGTIPSAYQLANCLAAKILASGPRLFVP